MHHRRHTTALDDARTDRPRRARARLARVALPMLVVGASMAAAPALATTVPDDETLRQGAVAYQSACSGCHQPGGVGISGQFPPLKDNPNVEDEEYLRGVIANGRTGELVVNGVTYNGVMPAQSTLRPDDVDLIVTYIQSGFAAPSAPQPELDTGPAAGTELPIMANWMYIVSMLIAIGAIGFVFAPRLVGASDRRTMPWLDAWLKTGVIVVGMIVATTIIPAQVLETETVRDLPRTGQDIIAVSLWLAGLGGGLWALWYAHREKRV